MDLEVREAERAWRAAGGGLGWLARPWPQEEQRAYLDALDRVGVLLPAPIRVALWDPSFMTQLRNWIRALGPLRNRAPELAEMMEEMNKPASWADAATALGVVRKRAKWPGGVPPQSPATRLGPPGVSYGQDNAD